MSRDVAFVIPTMDKPHLKICLAYLAARDRYPLADVHLVAEGKSWPEAVNIGLERAKGKDVILMDDDIFLTSRTFDAMEALFDKADIFGFKLWMPNGTLQHAGGVCSGGTIHHRFYAQPDAGQADVPLYVPHVTTSLCYIKKEVLEKLGGMATDYQGLQFEDVDFCMRALKAGFRIMYTPGPAVHLQSASKKDIPLFHTRATQNQLDLNRRFFQDEAFIKELEQYPKEVAA